MTQLLNNIANNSLLYLPKTQKKTCSYVMGSCRQSEYNVAICVSKYGCLSSHLSSVSPRTDRQRAMHNAALEVALY